MGISADHPATLDAFSKQQNLKHLLLADFRRQMLPACGASERDWSVGEIVHHLTLAEVATGKLTSKLLKDAAGHLRPYPAELTGFEPLPSAPPGPAEAPPVVRPEAGHPIDRLLADMRGARERSRQSLDRVAGVDPRPLVWRHFALGELNLAQWWMLQARHDGDHLQQLRRVKASPGFPRS